ncbi:GPP34 family phosphoprotein [Streptomyces sp. DW26H14]|uniref:GPP34 family phosphoprotein n=1 Tax=Streptomyces sp. DW26H14 TaxID=3435395 RepID=UPI00403E3346
MSLPALTLPEELMLLALDPATGKPRVRARHLHYGVAAAALAELEARRFVAEDRGRVVPLSPPPTGEPVLDAALGLFDDGRPVRARHWLRRRRSGAVTGACADSLAARGLITVETHRALGLFSVSRYPLVSPGTAEEAAADFRGAAKMGFPEPGARMLAALVSAIRLTRHVVPAGGSGRETRRTMRGLTRELWPARAVDRLIKSEASDAG